MSYDDGSWYVDPKQIKRTDHGVVWPKPEPQPPIPGLKQTPFLQMQERLILSMRDRTFEPFLVRLHACEARVNELSAWEEHPCEDECQHRSCRWTKRAKEILKNEEAVP